MSKNLVIVESPAKAKTIEKYLGGDFKVLSSVGHIRTDVAVDREHDFKVQYEIEEGHKKVVADLKKATKEAQEVWLATDEDREGEAISWHLREVLNLPDNTKRITFHEITKSALEEAVKSPRLVDMDMVASQQARQTLDMIVGYDLSGVVRRKVPGAISAGRVQSPALRLIVEREREIEKFKANSSFKVNGKFLTNKKEELLGNLNHDFSNESEAREFLEKLQAADFTVSNIVKTPGVRSPSAPFTTAALQIEANSKLGFSAKTTMSAAQGLYQAGHISYHRTDSVNLSTQALGAISGYINKEYGERYHQFRTYKTKNSSAQEAHEAIRPTNIANKGCGKNDYEQKLYQLIWARTIATQMANAEVEKTTISILPATSQTNQSDNKYIFEAKGEVVLFDGFLKVYGGGKDFLLPQVSVGDKLQAKEIVAKQNFERAPSRYTEGSLVKKLEELGIGRPSTYASIMNAIQTRGYVKKGETEGKSRDIIILSLQTTKNNSEISREVIQEKTGSDKGKLVPQPVGELISDFLTQYFDRIVDYSFTAEVEKDLDEIAEAKLDRVKMLQSFYDIFEGEVKKSDKAERFNNGRELGVDPKTNKKVFVKTGKSGEFLQLGENSEKTKGRKTKEERELAKLNAPRFAPLPQDIPAKEITLAQALHQFELPALPRVLGLVKNEKEGIEEEIVANNGPFGAYLKAGKYNIQIKDKDPYTITLKEAKELYEAKLASIIHDWGNISVIKGVYGPYVKGPGRLNTAKVPKEFEGEEITPEQLTKELAEKILAAKPAKRSFGRRKFVTKKK